MIIIEIVWIDFVDRARKFCVDKVKQKAFFFIVNGCDRICDRYFFFY